MKRLHFRVNKKAAAAIVGLFVLTAVTASRADYFMLGGAPVKVATGTSGSGYTNTEGPISDGTGNILFCELNSNHTGDLIFSYNTTSKTVSTVVSNSGGTEGDFYNSAGQLVTSDRDTRQVSVRQVGNISVVQTVLASSYAGKQLNGPNDLVVDSQGGVYFTDPNFENFSNRQSQDGVYYISPTGTLTMVLPAGNTRPNGLILSPDGKILYVDYWASNVIDGYNVNTPGNPTNGRQFATAASPDGLTIDLWGDVIAARSGGVSCWDPTGKKLFDASITEAGYDATNVELYGNSLYVTAGISLYQIPLTQVPEPSALGIFVLAAALAILSPAHGRRRYRMSRREISPRSVVKQHV